MADGAVRAVSHMGRDNETFVMAGGRLAAGSPAPAGGDLLPPGRSAAKAHRDSAADQPRRRSGTQDS